MSCRCAPSLVALRKQIDVAYPGRDRASDGCCGDPAHAARKSDHNPTNGYAHALDIDEDVASGRGDAALMFLVPLLLGDPRTKYLIYEARIFYAACSAHRGVCPGHAYSGPNAHTHHLHISIKSTATHDVSAWRITEPPAARPEEDDEDMGYRYDSFQRTTDKKIALHAPGYFKPLTPEEWQVFVSKGLANPNFETANEREWDVIRGGAFGGEEPEKERAAD